MTFCLTCNVEKRPVVALTKDGVVKQCPTCETVFERLNPDPPADPAAVSELAAPPAIPIASPSAAPSDALSLIDQLRARLAFCEEQIAARDGFIAEREMLRKMLAAADGETRPAVALPLN